MGLREMGRRVQSPWVIVGIVIAVSAFAAGLASGIPSGVQQAAGPRQRVDHVRHLRPLAPRLAAAGRRSIRRCDEASG